MESPSTPYNPLQREDVAPNDQQTVARAADRPAATAHRVAAQAGLGLDTPTVADETYGALAPETLEPGRVAVIGWRMVWYNTGSMELAAINAGDADSNGVATDDTDVDQESRRMNFSVNEAEEGSSVDERWDLLTLSDEDDARPASPPVDEDDWKDQVTGRNIDDEDLKEKPPLTFDAEADYERNAAVDDAWDDACYGRGVEHDEHDAQLLPQLERDPVHDVLRSQATARLACARDGADATGVAGSAAFAATAQNDPPQTGVQTVAIPTAALAAAATPASTSAPSPTPSLREGASPGPTAAISGSPRLTPAAGRKVAGRATRRPASPSLATPAIVDSFVPPAIVDSFVPPAIVDSFVPPQVSPANKRFRAKIIDTREEVSYLVARVFGSQSVRSDWREREETLQMQ